MLFSYAEALILSSMFDLLETHSSSLFKSLAFFPRNLISSLGKCGLFTLLVDRQI